MKTTPNLGLRKPEQTDFYNVDDFNYNADVIDQELTEAKATANQTASALAAHLNDFLQVWNNRIVEIGSNANGTYVRWENGLQICLHRFAGSLQAGEIKAEDWIFPASFGTGTIYLICGGGPASDNIQLLEYGFNTQAAQNTNTKTRVVRRNTHTTNSDTSSLYVMAVGRWK